MSAVERLAWADCEAHHSHDDLSDLTLAFARPCDASRSSATATLAADSDLHIALEHGLAFHAAAAALPGDHVGPTLDRGDGVWVASAFPPIEQDGSEPDAIEAEAETPDEAYLALAALFSGRVPA